MANPEFLYPAMRRRTRAALRQLFLIMDIEGKDFDDQLFELATRAFTAWSTPPPGHKFIKRARSKQPRRKIEVKAVTAIALEDIYCRLFPYLPWQSWTWYMEQILKILEEQVHEKKDDYALFKGKADEMDVYKERED